MYNHKIFDSPYNSYGDESLALEDSYNNAIARVILVAIRNGLLPTFFYGQNPLQLMRAIIVEPGKRFEFHSPNFMLDTLPRAFFSAPGDSPPENSPFSPRPVKGKILRDEAGRFYEKIGSQVRPLYKLVSGPHGDIVELVPSFQRRAGMEIPGSDKPSPFPEEVPENAEEILEEVQPSSERIAKKLPDSEALSRPATPPPAFPFFRALFPGPGLQRPAQWGDFKQMLKPQVAHPEALKDEQRLPCYVQIYEVKSALRLESLAAAILGDGQDAGQLGLFTFEAARKLRLEAVLQQRPRLPLQIPREPGVLLPFDLVFRLQLAKAPSRNGTDHYNGQSQRGATATVNERFEPEASLNNNTLSPPYNESGWTQNPPAAKPEEFVPPASRINTGSDADSIHPKRDIPRQFLKLHEFRFSREEVLYDMRLEESSQGWLNPFFRWLKGLFAENKALRKWQALLRGKNIEEQLWAVRPPKGMLSHPAIRDWACQTLAMAGYDPQTMLPEWEVFWRRKGV